VSDMNADHVSLVPFAERHRIPYHDYEDDRHLRQWLTQIEYDVIYCFGWSHLLSAEVIGSARLGAIGYHPTLLPMNRGRHPIIWALALGLTETGSTFFYIDQGADSGDIVSQERVLIDDEDDARTLYDRLIAAARVQLVSLTNDLYAGQLQAIPQNDSLSNYWRKRNANDGLIDWRMSSKSIFNLVRALTRPYVGAHCVYKGEQPKVWKVQIIAANDQLTNVEPGKVLNVEFDSRSLDIKTGDGIVRLIEHTLSPIPAEGEYIR
jgi:methionyl-tRNA formyltransferase